MKLSVFSSGLQHLDWPGLLHWLAEHGVPHLELGCGAYPGTHHADAHLLRADAGARRQLQADCRAHGIALAALSCHGNPLHPNPALAAAHHADLMAAIEAASSLDVPVVVAFSGQPGSPAGSEQHPNWPVVGWPFEFAELREWQWTQRLIPYWQPVAERAQSLSVRIALELHGGFAVHSPSTLLRLRAACGPALCANLDPSHLWWQQIDPVAAVALLGEAVAHVHLKDTVFNPAALALHGVLDATAHADPYPRAWRFGVPGDGHSPDTWRALLAALDRVGYAGVLSVEHEAPMPAPEGIAQALAFMRGLQP